MNRSAPSNTTAGRWNHDPLCVRSMCFLLMISMHFGCPGTKNDPASTVNEFHRAAVDQHHAQARKRVHRPEDYNPSQPPGELPPQGTAHVFWEFKSSEGTVVIEKSENRAFISKGILKYDSRETPEETLRSFASALRHQQPDLLVQFVPSSQGTITVDEMNSFLQQSLFQRLLENWSSIETPHAPHEILERTQHHAVIGSRTHVFWLVAEPTGWKVKDVQEKTWR
jgi:hypothetical protein